MQSEHLLSQRYRFPTTKLAGINTSEKGRCFRRCSDLILAAELVESKLADMATATSTTNHRESWDSLSSTFASLEVSFTHDSCYGSDEVSVSSNSTAPLQSSFSNFAVKREAASFHPILKPILKSSSTGISDDTDPESGYESDGIEFDYDALAEVEDDEDDMSDFSVWEETPDNVPETRVDHTESFDDTFIGFETMVRFDPEVQFIESADFSDDEETRGNQMTFHEMMLLSQQPRQSQSSSHLSEDAICDDDEFEASHKEFRRVANHQPEDFTRDAVDVDRQLFVAYMNGMHGIADTKYKSYLRIQVDNIRHGHEAESVHPDDGPCMYLDLITQHVIGVFRNLLAVEELDALIELRQGDSMTNETPFAGLSNPALNHHQALLDKIEHILLDRLTNGRIDVCPDELSFFAGGIAHALGTKELPASC